jgi:Dynein heavy chain, N-terminal region 2.
LCPPGLEFGTKKLKPRDPNDPNEEPRFVTTPDIVAMISPEQETVRLGKGLTARGSVEDWLSKVEKSMFITLRRLMKAALLDFSTRKRTEWVLRHPSQIVLTISQVSTTGWACYDTDHMGLMAVQSGEVYVYHP